MNIKTSSMQALLAGNFINLGLLIIFVVSDNIYGQLLIIASWGCAYLSGFIQSLAPEDGRYTGKIGKMALSRAGRMVVMGLGYMCIVLTLAALAELIQGIT